MKLSYLLFYLLFFIGFMTVAQSPKQDFTKAEEFYKNGNFTEAVTQTESVKKSLGKSNPKVEALLFMAYYKTEDYTKAKVAYETLKLMVPDNVKNSDAFKLYKTTGEQLDKKLVEIQTVFEQKQNESAKSLYDDSKYEDRNDYKEDRIKRKKEVYDRKIAIIQENNENEASQVLEQILKNPTKEKFENYLLEERYNSKFDEAKKYITYWYNHKFELLDYDTDDSQKSFKYKNLKYYLNLRKLTLTGSRIYEIPEIIFNCGKLEEFIVYKTSVRSIPNNITICRNLKKISLFTNESLRTIPDDLSMFEKLEYLYLSPEATYELPNILGLENLESLSINMALKEIPMVVFTFKKLKKLELMSIGRGNLFEFPEELGQLKNLEVLTLNWSSVSELPKSISSLEKLRYLSIYGTPITDLPSGLKELSNLKFLRVGGNKYKPYNNKKVERDLKKLTKALPNLEVNYN